MAVATVSGQISLQKDLGDPNDVVGTFFITPDVAELYKEQSLR